MRIRVLVATAVFVLAATLTASPAAASAAAFCTDLGAEFDGQYCRTQIVSQRNAVRDIKVAVPGELIDDPVAGPVIRDYLHTLVNDWRRVGTTMVADSFGEANHQIVRSDDTVTAVFRETYHADGPAFNNAYRTFTFDTANGRRVQLADLTTPGIDPLVAIPPLAGPFVVEALDRAPPAHQPGTYPFIADRWTPDKVYSGAYKAWALTADELILYMPDYPVAHDVPLDYTPGVMQWSMDGGTVQAHIPLSALASVLRPEYGGT
jgi:hypothetical protein